MLRKIYLKIKKIPLIGTIAVGARNVFMHPIFERRRLFRRDVQEARRVVVSLFGEESNAERYMSEFLHSPSFQKKYAHGHSGDFDVMILYVVTRIAKPSVIIETGVASGRSSAAILQALHDNKKGMLYSIDLPQYYDGTEPQCYVTKEGNNELEGFIPQGKTPGWLVPEALRSRWKLILGDSKVELEKVLSSVDKVDIFYHDSDHSYESMDFEYKAVWPKIPQGGFLLSDDVSWNDAWKDFTAARKYSYRTVYRNFGVLKK